MFPLRCIFPLIVEAINFLTDTGRSFGEVVKVRKAKDTEENEIRLYEKTG